jgi:hypothetical protein
VTRRAPLPGAAELFRPTALPPVGEGPSRPARRQEGQEQSDVSRSRRRGSPRQKHDAKITVYVSDEELVALEHARLSLRAIHGLAVDRGRVVREAIAVLLADLEEHGENSMLVRRLRQEAGN